MIYSTVARLAIGAACLIAAAGCGGEMLRTGRSPVYLVVTQVQASQGNGGSQFAFLLSDVETLVDTTVNGATVKVPTYFNDNVTVTLAADLKNPAVAATAINNVTMTRYHVDYRRADGRNTPGVDVPFSIDGGLSATIPAGGTGSVAFEIVRHQAKLEPPLRQLRNINGFGGTGFISTIAEITLYGRDQNGNEVIATARMDIMFGDYGDE
jgi:hypothetical protein